MDHPCLRFWVTCLTCTIVHVLAEVQSLLDHKICILLHVRPIDPIATQSVLDNEAFPSLACKSAASAAVGKESANPSPAAAALRAPSALTCVSASPQSRAAALGFCIRSLKLALAIWMQARSRIRSRPPCGAAAHTASSTSWDSQKYPASLSAIP